MDTGWTQDLLNWLNANPAWGFAFVFTVAFLESLVLVGILLPGIVILFGVGALIGLGVLEVIPIWVAASIGAMLGDGLSYFLGRRFRDHLVDFWPFSRYPAVIERGKDFFRQHGTKSIVAGRFIGPLRPIIPAVGGMLGMPPTRFLAVDIPSCIAWAPAFLLPGVLFGASLEVASEYTGRLTAMLVIGLVILWLTWWLIRLIYEPLASRSARWIRHGIRWSRRHPVLGRITGPLIDPSRPEAISVAMMGILLVLIFWGLVMLLFLGPFSSQPQGVDQTVQLLAQSLRNHLADPFMVAIAQMSRWPVSVLSAFALLLWLLGAGRRKAAAHWLVAIGGGFVLQQMLAWTLRATPQMFEVSSDAIRGPSASMGLPTVALTFFAVMVASDLARKHRQWPYILSGLLVILLAMARIYLGMEWFSGAMMGIAMGVAWTAVVGIAYRQRAWRHFSGAMACVIFYGSFFILLAWQVSERTADELEALQPQMTLVHMDADAWWDGRWSELPEFRTGVVRSASRAFNAQVAATPDRVSELLQEAGWRRVEQTDWRWLVQSLNPDPDAATLPLISRLFQGRQEVLLLRRDLPNDGGLQTIRLWDSGVRLMPGEQPLYLGQLSYEVIRLRLGIFSYWRSQPESGETFQPIRQALEPLEDKTVKNGLLLIRAN